MAVKEGNTRIMVTTSDVNAQKLDTYAESLGMTRSALAAYFLGVGLMSFEKSNDLIDRMGDTALDSVKK